MPSLPEEKEAIRDVLSHYCFCLDGGRFAEMAALFTPDGVWETAFGTGKGTDGIIELVTRISRPPGAEPRHIHMISNVLITIDGERARVQSNWIAVGNSRRGPVIESGGAYFDEMVKHHGHWRFAHRRIDRFVADTRGPAHQT